MPRPLVKICGLTTIADMRLAIELGADYVGMIVDIPRSKRNLSLEVAMRLRRHAGDKAVLVTADLTAQRLLELAAVLQPAVIQLHGSEHPQFIASLRRELSKEIAVWKSLGVPARVQGPGQTLSDLLRDARAYGDAGCAMLVLDTVGAGGMGGTGQTSDWELAAEVVAGSEVPVLLAGGIGPDNIVEAAQVVSPRGFDLSSCVEERPGKKSPVLLTGLFEKLLELG